MNRSGNIAYRSFPPYHRLPTCSLISKDTNGQPQITVTGRSKQGMRARSVEYACLLLTVRVDEGEKRSSFSRPKHVDRIVIKWTDREGDLRIWSVLLRGVIDLFYICGLLYILSVFCSPDSDPGERLQAAELLTKLQADKLTGPRWTRFITKFLPPIFADALRDSPNTADPGERLQAAELLTKLQADKLTGPRWTRFITKFLPPIFADALRDSPNTAITMFDSTNENPELIWNDATRVKVRQIIERGVSELHRAQSSNPEHKWDTGSLADDSCAYADSVTGELVVGGVFVRLYVANPAWAVRHPRQFATELIEKVLELMHKPSPDLTLVTTAFIELLRNFPNTADQLPAQGYLPQFSKAMSAKDPQT
ncbi:unnamed protein product, partial [Strongylus vulgaris]